MKSQLIIKGYIVEETKKEMTVIEVPVRDIVSTDSYYDRIIEMAIESTDLDKIEKFMDLKERHEANEARKAFHFAMAEFKKQPILIGKDKKNTQYNSMYTTIGNLVNTIAPTLGKHGLSHKWDIEQSSDGMVKVTCVATHSLGYSDSCSMFAPPDKSGAKNAIQQIKSTRTYLQAATFESLFGLASSDANINDDGNSSALVECIGEKQISQLTDMLLAIEKSESDYCKYLKVSSLENIPLNMFSQCVIDLKPEDA